MDAMLWRASRGKRARAGTPRKHANNQRFVLLRCLRRFILTWLNGPVPTGIFEVVQCGVVALLAPLDRRICCSDVRIVGSTLRVCGLTASVGGRCPWLP